MKELLKILSKRVTSFPELQESFNAAQAICGKTYPNVQEKVDFYRREIIRRLYTPPNAGVIFNYTTFSKTFSPGRWEDVELTPEIDFTAMPNIYEKKIVPSFFVYKLRKWHRRQISIVHTLMGKRF